MVKFFDHKTRKQTMNDQKKKVEKIVKSRTLKEVLKKHTLWIQGKEGGERLNLTGADLTGVNFRASLLNEADFSKADLSSADFANALFYKNNFLEVNLQKSFFIRTDFSRSCFSHCLGFPLEDIPMLGNSDRVLRFQGNDILADIDKEKKGNNIFAYNPEVEEILRKHKLWLLGEEGGEYLDLSEANLNGAIFTGAKCRNASFVNVCFTKADFSSTQMPFSDFTKASMRRCFFAQTDFCFSDFSGANKRKCDVADIPVMSNQSSCLAHLGLEF